MAPPSVDIELSVEKQNVTADSTQDVFVNVRVRAPSSSPEIFESRAPLRLCAVLDRSGSMRGEKLALLQRSMRYVIDYLSPTDSLSVVAYGSMVDVVAPMCLSDSSGKQLQRRAVDALSAGTCTNLSGGLLRGLSQLSAGLHPSDDDDDYDPAFECSEEVSDASVIVDAMSAGDVGCVWLFTDGHANQGITDVSVICDAVLTAREKLRARGRHVTVSCFGFGDHNPNFMRAIAEAGAGTYAYVSTADDVGTAFGGALAGLMTLTLRDIALSVTIEATHVLTGRQPETLGCDVVGAPVECCGDDGLTDSAPVATTTDVGQSIVHHAVPMRSLIAAVHTPYTVERHPVANSATSAVTERLLVRVPDMYADEQRDIVLVVAVPRAAVASTVSISAEVTGMLVATSTPVVNAAYTEIVRVAEEGEPTAPPNVIVEQRLRLETASALEEAKKLAAAGDFRGARSRIEHSRGLLARAPRSEAANALSRDLDLCAAPLESTMTWFADGEKMFGQLEREHRTQRSCGDWAGGKARAAAYSTIAQTNVKAQFLS